MKYNKIRKKLINQKLKQIDFTDGNYKLVFEEETIIFEDCDNMRIFSCNYLKKINNTKHWNI